MMKSLIAGLDNPCYFVILIVLIAPMALHDNAFRNGGRCAWFVRRSSFRRDADDSPRS
jgi:hypothetical protein